MKFYLFGGSMDPVIFKETLNDGFDGVMFTYDLINSDIFTYLASQPNKNLKVKCLVAIRPYTISPQYLYMINKSMQKIMPNTLQINFIQGYTKDYEKDFGGIFGEVNDMSSSVDKSNYLINYLDVLNTMQKNEKNQYPLDFYVSTSNKYVMEAVQKYDNKIILPYKKYKNKHWVREVLQTGKVVYKDPIDLKNTKVMLAITPILRKNKEDFEDLPKDYADRPVWREGERPHAVSDVVYFTYEEFGVFLDELKKEGIEEVLMNAYPHREYPVIKHYLKKYVRKQY
jgi:hypothetical protein